MLYRCAARNSWIENGSGRTGPGGGVARSGIRGAALADLSALARATVGPGPGDCATGPGGNLTEETAASRDGWGDDNTGAGSDRAGAGSPSVSRETVAPGGNVFSDEADVGAETLAVD